MPIEPDTKDWTWVLQRPCPDCLFDPATVDREDLSGLIHENTRGWYDVLDGPEVSVRPDESTWSDLEYACHVRDVHRLFAQRLELMLTEDDPEFVNWDQDETAIAADYGSQDPAVVITELIEAAAEVAAVYARVRNGEWARTGRRDNGSRFTVETLGSYHLHDVAHHLWDVSRAAG